MEPPRNNQPKIDYKMFGNFKCKNCFKVWSSGNTWKNYAQKCSNCDEYVYPYQRKLKAISNSKSKVKRPHVSEFCEKCIELNDLCTKYRSSAMDRRRKGKGKRYYLGNNQNRNEGENLRGSNMPIRGRRARNPRYIRARRGAN